MSHGLASASDAKRLFCFGLGYTALTLVNKLAAQGWTIAGTVRTAEKAEALASREALRLLAWHGHRHPTLRYDHLDRVIGQPDGKGGAECLDASVAGFDDEGSYAVGRDLEVGFACL